MKYLFIIHVLVWFSLFIIYGIICFVMWEWVVFPAILIRGIEGTILFLSLLVEAYAIGSGEY